MENRNVNMLHKLLLKISRTVKQSKGMTMIELVITMVLLSLFATGVCQILATSIRSYHDMRNLQESQEVSSTILDKICGEIEGAQPSFEAKLVSAEGGFLSDDEENTGTLALYEEHKTIFLVDRLGSKIWIGTKPASDGNSYLNIHYYPIKEKKDGAVITKYEGVDWKYDPKTYMGFSIEELKFEFPGLNPDSQYPKNLVKVTLKLKNKSGEVYPAERYIECYNFKESKNDFDKIIDHGNAELPEE